MLKESLQHITVWIVHLKCHLSQTDLSPQFDECCLPLDDLILLYLLSKPETKASVKSDAVDILNTASLTFMKTCVCNVVLVFNF